MNLPVNKKQCTQIMYRHTIISNYGVNSRIYAHPRFYVVKATAR